MLTWLLRVLDSDAVMQLVRPDFKHVTIHICTLVKSYIKDMAKLDDS